MNQYILNLDLSKFTFVGYNPLGLINNPKGIIILQNKNIRVYDDLPMQIELPLTDLNIYQEVIKNRLNESQDNPNFRDPKVNFDYTDFDINIQRLKGLDMILEEINKSFEIPQVSRQPKKFKPESVIIEAEEFNIRKFTTKKMEGIAPYKVFDYREYYEYVFTKDDENFVLTQIPSYNSIMFEGLFKGRINQNINQISNYQTDISKKQKQQIIKIAQKILKIPDVRFIDEKLQKLRFKL